MVKLFGKEYTREELLKEWGIFLRSVGYGSHFER